jgi:hypothetical protein
MITINNWSKFQSYKDRKPPWIRFHRSMLDNYDYQMMSAESRALLPMLWLLACEDEDPTSGEINLEVKVIAYRLRRDEKVIKKSVAELETSGFIACADSVTNPLRIRNETVTGFRKNVTTETETETETEAETETDARLARLGVDKALWIEYLGTRRKLKCNTSERAINTLFNRIEKLVREGQDATAMLEEANAQSWKTVYSAKEEKHEPTALQLATNTDWAIGFIQTEPDQQGVWDDEGDISKLLEGPR